MPHRSRGMLHEVVMARGEPLVLALDDRPEREPDLVQQHVGQHDADDAERLTAALSDGFDLLFGVDADE